MSYQEKRSLVYLSSTLLIMGLYYFYIFSVHPEESWATPTNFKFWGITVLMIVPMMIGVNIINHILFNIVNVIATREKMPGITDELDRLIELRANQNAYSTFMFGFLLSMVVLVMEYPPYMMFNGLVHAVLAASVVWSISHIYYYRRGI